MLHMCLVMVGGIGFNSTPEVQGGEGQLLIFPAANIAYRGLSANLFTRNKY